MKKISALIVLALAFATGTWSPSTATQARTQAPRPSAPAAVYYPGPGNDWEHRSPEQSGMNAQLLNDAIAFAKASETKNPRDLALEHQLTYRNEPMNEPLGPFKTRGDMTGVILRHGYIVAEWGEPERVDMTFSMTKSFLSTTVALAWERGLIRDLNDRVQQYMPTEEFASELNSRITWDNLLRQTSDWEGTLWGKPDWSDRAPRDSLAQYIARRHNEPGTSWKYNDVRVNLLALAALNVWRRPLPQVLREYVMDPIGASSTWRWYGYDNSWVNIDGVMMQSVSGGGHQGGGMFISARDQARFGLLTLRRGRWKDKQIIPEAWVKLALTPTPVQPTYGIMNWYLNTDLKGWPDAPASTFCHMGAGNNVACEIPEYDLVVVARWITGPGINGILKRVVASVTDVTAMGKDLCAMMPEKDQGTHAAFVGSIPEAYDRYLGPVIFAPYAEDLSNRVRAHGRGGDVLETACGTGVLTRRLSAVLGPDVRITATDLNEKMFAHAREHMPDAHRINWQEADASALPFDDGSFGTVTCQFGMMFVPDKAAAVREAHRVLTRDGLFAFNTWCGFDENAFGRIAHQAIGRFFPDNPPTFYLTQFGWHDQALIESLLKTAGFTEIAIEHVTLEAWSRSAGDFAIGLVEGNPVAHAIRERGLAFPPIIDAVARDLASEGGDAPFRSPMSALVATARSR